MSRNGVITSAWFARAYSSSAESMRSSYRSGELTLINEISAGVCSSDSPPNTISAIAIVSAAFGPEVTEPMNGLSDRVKSA
jgi:hypothetical protein